MVKGRRTRLTPSAEKLLDDLNAVAKNRVGEQEVTFYTHAWAGEFDRNDRANSVFNIESRGTDPIAEMKKVSVADFDLLVDAEYVRVTSRKGVSQYVFVLA